MARKTYLTAEQLTRLNDACIPIQMAFDSPPYLVGSTTERADFRDVDLRVILADEEFDRLFGDRLMLWSLVCTTISRHLAAVTDLPIDFQIQRMTEANEKHPGTHRNPMGWTGRPLAGGGDATRW